MKTLLLNTGLAFSAGMLMMTNAMAEAPSFTKGIAKTTQPSLIDCGFRSRNTAVGEITSEDGKVWTVPAATAFETGPKATDLFNECGGIELDDSSELDLSKVPVADLGGEETFTAYVFADNYFEWYINGQLIAVDPVTFTPFNSNVIRFKVDKPFTVAVKMVDWEETLGLGVESGRGSKYHPGDGGLVAQIQDERGKIVAITDENWKAQTFYIAPLLDRSCLSVDGQVRDSAACGSPSISDPAQASAAHWEIPENWAAGDFDDSIWPSASTFSNETVGVDNKRGYTNFTDLFDAQANDPKFIWSSNLILDNLVLLRTTVQ